MKLLLMILLLTGSCWQAASAAAAADETIAVEDSPDPADGSSHKTGSEEAETEEAESEEADFDKRLDALLSEVTAADAYGDPIHCLYNRKYRHIDVISENMLLFYSRNNYWVNELKRSCVGLSRDMVMHTVIKGINSLCEGDLVFANRRFDMDMGLTSSGRPLVVRATCSLGEFKPIDEVYAQSLKEMAR